MTEKRPDFVCSVRKIGAFFAGKGYWGKPIRTPRTKVRGVRLVSPSFYKNSKARRKLRRALLHRGVGKYK